MERYQEAAKAIDKEKTRKLLKHLKHIDKEKETKCSKNEIELKTHDYQQVKYNNRGKFTNLNSRMKLASKLFTTPDTYCKICFEASRWPICNNDDVLSPQTKHGARLVRDSLSVSQSLASDVRQKQSN